MVTYGIIFSYVTSFLSILGLVRHLLRNLNSMSCQALVWDHVSLVIMERNREFHVLRFVENKSISMYGWKFSVYPCMMKNNLKQLSFTDSRITIYFWVYNWYYVKWIMKKYFHSKYFVRVQFLVSYLWIFG